MCSKKIDGSIMQRIYFLLALLILSFSKNSIANEIYDGMSIVKINIQTNNVFEAESLDTLPQVYEAANFLHVKTRKSTIASQILFKVGDRYQDRLARESERILRKNKYIREATISARPINDGLEIVVSTHDAWSTKPEVSFGRTGGASKSSLGLEEDNFLGLGLGLTVSYRKDPERSSTNFRLEDNDFLKNGYNVFLQHSKMSDGHLNSVKFANPFDSLDSRSSYGLRFNDYQRTQSTSHHGMETASFYVSDQNIDLNRGWSAGLIDNNVWRSRFGIYYSYSETEVLEIQGADTLPPFSNSQIAILSTPHTREFYPYYSLEFTQDRFDTTINYQKLVRTEDRYLGLSLGMRLGLGKVSADHSDKLVKIDGSFNKSHLYKSDILLRYGAIIDANYKIESQSVYNTTLEYFTEIYVPQGRNTKFYSKIKGIKSHNLEFVDRFVVDEENGLRGYPHNFIFGDSVHQLTIEERFYSARDYFSLFNLGAAVFVDVAHVVGEDTLGDKYSELYKSFGVGLRVSNSHSSSGDIIHINFSKPISNLPETSKYQFSIQSSTTF